MSSKRIVLIVEDNEELRRLYADVFQHYNFTVVQASDGKSAVDFTLLHRPDVIILDLLLPRQGGLATLRVLRTLPECKHTPIVILTALPNPEYKEVAGNRVQGFYLKTEITPKQLVDKVQTLLTS